MTERTNKPFFVLLVIAAAIGVGIGGVFAGGVALGKASGEDTPTALFAGGPTANSTGGTGQDGRGQFNRSQGGPVQPGLPQRPGGQFDRLGTGPQSPDSPSVDGAVQSSSRRGVVSGTVEKVEGNVVTITTTDGPVEVTIADTTAISQISRASVDDLQTGNQVTAMGPAGEDGRVEAANLVITPEGMESPFGRGRQGDRNFQPGARQP